MRVADLIRASEWIPNSDYCIDDKPAVSIVLPTWRRAAGGLLRRAIRSVLDQELRDIELIVIDDGSTDGSADLIRDVMEQDRRVHCIRHPETIGLPAISMFEGYERARADYFAAAFDDDAFTREGLACLHAYAVANGSRAVHGYARYGFQTGKGERRVIELGRQVSPGVYALQPEWCLPDLAAGNQATCLWRINAVNMLSNLSVLVHRDVFEMVGFYDPHVVMVRVCDWDLWTRVAARLPIDYVDVYVADDNLERLPDTLGRTVDIDMRHLAEYVAIPRNDALVPSRFVDFEPAHVPVAASHRVAAYVARSVRALQRGGRLKHVAEATPHRRVVFLYDQGPSTHLLFDGLPADLRAAFYFHHGNSGWDELWPLLANASALVVCGPADTFARLGVDAELTALGVPVYLYPAGHPVPRNIEQLIPGLAGVVGWPLCFGGPWPSARIDHDHIRPHVGTLRVGAVGLTAQDAHAVERSGAGQLRKVAKEMGWAQIVGRWRRAAIDVLVIGSERAPETAFDGHAGVLLAYLVGATPIVLGDDRLAELDESVGVARAVTPDDVRSVVDDMLMSGRRSDLAERLTPYCRSEYGPTAATAAARAFLEQLTPVDALDAEERWRRLERLRTETIVAQHELIEALQARVADLEVQAGTRFDVAPH